MMKILKKLFAEPTIDARLKSINEKLQAGTLSPTETKLLDALGRGKTAPADISNILRQSVDVQGMRGFLSEISKQSLDSGKVDFLWRQYRTGSYLEDLVATSAAANWLEDPGFLKAYATGESIGSWDRDLKWRAHTLVRCAQTAMTIEGDFVECGVDRGGLSRCVIEYIGSNAFDQRNFYLFDTFKGLVASQIGDHDTAAREYSDQRYPDVLDEVRERFSSFGFTRIVPGAVPNTLAEFAGDKVAYLHIDMNVAEPEVAALEFFWPKLSPGAPVVFDDYGFPKHEHQRDEIDRVASKLGCAVMMLPTGQGLLWKTAD